ncbi:protein serine/threonine phosphatase 2C, partial [Metschnikowia bicuspidata var. bicuspidata NRRL YB-4993]
MGQLMSHPMEEKSIEYHTFDTISYCVGAMQGYRLSMEDAHDARISENEALAVFGVFDGHGGKDVAHILRSTLVAKIFKHLNGYITAGSAPPRLATFTKTLTNCFFEVDAGLPDKTAANCGSTAIVLTVVAGRYIIVANTGDSRSILSLPGGHAKTLSFDHKPSHMGERVRIENSGGYVLNSRVNEILALSRAFGDLKFKIPWLQLDAVGKNNSVLEQNRKYCKQDLVLLPPELFQVTVEPELMVYDLQALDMPEFMVLACDGIWDCFTNDQLVRAIREKLGHGWTLQHITEYVLNECIAMASSATGIGFDNMTLMIVALHPKTTMDEWRTAM